jgi:hypothetical protein
MIKPFGGDFAHISRFPLQSQVRLRPASGRDLVVTQTSAGGAMA